MSALDPPRRVTREDAARIRLLALLEARAWALLQENGVRPNRHARRRVARVVQRSRRARRAAERAAREAQARERARARAAATRRRLAAEAARAFAWVRFAFALLATPAVGALGARLTAMPRWAWMGLWVALTWAWLRPKAKPAA